MGSVRDEVGLIRAIAVKVRILYLGLLSRNNVISFLGTLLCQT